jgi:putative intracellular protease/amidase
MLGAGMTHSVLIVTTSTGELPDGRETGFDWASLAVPYWRLREAGVHVGFASVAGGKPPGDAATAIDESGETLFAVDMFLSDERAVRGLERTAALAEIDPADWTALLFAGGLGALWDVPASEETARLIDAAWAHGAPLAAIGAGTAALTVGRDGAGHAIVAGRRVTCLPDAAVNEALDGEDAPTMPESRLRAQGAQVWVAEPDEGAAVIDDGRLITGRDGHAAAEVALQLLEALDIYAPAAGREREEGAPGAAEQAAGATPAEPGEGADPEDEPGTKAPR